MAGEARHLLTCPHFPLWEKSLGPELCFLGGRVTWVKSGYSSFPLQCVQTCIYIFLFQQCAGTLPLETWASTKVFLLVGDCLRQCSPGAPRLQARGAGAAWSRFKGHFRVHSLDQGVCACDPMLGWVRLLPGLLAYGAGSHSSH